MGGAVVGVGLNCSGHLDFTIVHAARSGGNPTSGGGVYSAGGGGGGCNGGGAGGRPLWRYNLDAGGGAGGFRKEKEVNKRIKRKFIVEKIILLNKLLIQNKVY